MPFEEADLDMQPLSRVVPESKMVGLDIWPRDAMVQRPKVAVLVAEAIAEWAQVECSVGVILAVILETEAQTALAMFSALTSSNNQMTIVEAAAKAKLTKADSDLLSALLKIARRAAKERHKLAHWCWALAYELPEALLLIDPDYLGTLIANMNGYHDALAPVDRTRIFVLKETDAKRIVEKISESKELANRVLIVFLAQDRQKRAELREKLCDEHPIRTALGH
jgi:hypothetical protein